MYFDELDLHDNVLDALYDMKFDKCTPVQEACIPEILKGNDMLGVAQTGTGKTAAYLLPILDKLDSGNYPADAINAVIMSPTRELAQQIDQAMQGFSYYIDNVSSVAVYGGNDGNRYDQELKSLRMGADVVIATPGRLISHISLGNVDFSKVSFFVLDEADRMLDMGFSEDILQIAKLLPPTCQTIMFSATMPDKIEELAKTLLKNPVEVKLAVSKPAEKIKQQAYVCYNTQKMDVLKDVFKEQSLSRVIIFCGSKMKVKQVNGALQRKHINCGEMHSDLSQAERDEIMFQFKSGKLDVLVATDIVARGIDIDDITMVINYDVPRDAEDYVHRIGRTARAERDGRAITLVSDEDMYYFQQIEKFLEKEVEKLPLPDGIGEGPEYKAQKSRPSKSTSAKSRRRKDRDAQSHKRKPHKPSERQEKQAKPKQQEEKPEQAHDVLTLDELAATVTPENGALKPKAEQAEGAEPAEKKKRHRSRKRKPAATKEGVGEAEAQQPRNDKQGEGRKQRSEKPAAEKDSQQDGQKAGKRRRGRGRGNGERPAAEGKPQQQPKAPKADKPKFGPVVNPGQKSEGTIKKIFKKLFRF